MEKIKIIGWDIGGANIKATKIIYNKKTTELESIKSSSSFFAMWNRNKNPLELIESIYQNLGKVDYFAITMTAELADRFSSKIEGIIYFVNLFKNNYTQEKLYFYNNQAQALNLDNKVIKNQNKNKNQDPVKEQKNFEKLMSLAAANWAVSAAFAAEFKEDFVLFDLGSSTIDLIPVKNKKIIALGSTDVQRLETGELIYLGLLRTNLSNLVDKVPFQGKMIAVINEYFASTADLHLLKGLIDTAAYSVSPADNGEKTIKAAKARIARMISLDLNLISDSELMLIVDYIYEQEIGLIYNKLLQLFSRFSSDFNLPLLMNNKAALLKKDLELRSKFSFQSLTELIPLLENNILTTTAAAFLLLKKIINQDLGILMGLKDE
ncbi:MAG: H4MPT-linked C1 transfer pathway protein [Halanaerobium sp. MDAL1]|nr:MAG: H4MPT-linked C1 transfer pathway protein [Halanaerobium sp. MDAL1]